MCKKSTSWCDVAPVSSTAEPCSSEALGSAPISSVGAETNQCDATKNLTLSPLVFSLSGTDGFLDYLAIQHSF